MRFKSPRRPAGHIGCDRSYFCDVQGARKLLVLRRLGSDRPARFSITPVLTRWLMAILGLASLRLGILARLTS